MYKMGSHDSFRYLKHKLWPKEGLLKVGNHLGFLVCKWRAIYCWKALNEGYKFSWDLTLIKGLHIKLWTSKVARVPILGISGLPLWSPKTKWYLGADPVARHKEYYKGESGGFH